MLLQIVLLGLGATLVMDAWALLRKRLWGMASLDYALVGRWLGHMPAGRFRHPAIAQARPVAGERVLGWVFHYLTGLVFAALFVWLSGAPWLCQPHLLPALGFGAVTVLLPMLLMQPGFGMDIAARRTPKPWLARRRALLTHLVFGLGLYLTGWLLSLLGCVS